MIWNIHGTPTNAKVDFNPATIGNNEVVAANASGETFILALAIIVDGDAVLTFKCGSREVGLFKLLENQTVSLSELPGMEGQPFFACAKTENFNIVSSAAVRITGTVMYALKN